MKLRRRRIFPHQNLFADFSSSLIESNLLCRRRTGAQASPSNRFLFFPHLILDLAPSLPVAAVGWLATDGGRKAGSSGRGGGWLGTSPSIPLLPHLILDLPPSLPIADVGWLAPDGGRKAGSSGRGDGTSGRGGGWLGAGCR
ncbi:unnamed protein product [Linum trigynum]|uniref:Uncharacterized protein n=1 Tax=Linum trigynum TaxID=586398 RepID=A0AAV2EBX7_9ROSI